MAATTIQERLLLKQFQVDTWTTREQLCLASAVVRSGDQNWVAVSRNIRLLTTEIFRPPDWYSTKNCALQYAKLLEQVDTPKRKRERGDVNSNETPGEIVTKMLNRQRVEELTEIIAEEQKQYNQLCIDIQQLETGQHDNSLDQMWDEMTKEHEKEEEDDRQRSQKLKERKEKIIAIQQALKNQGYKVTLPTPSIPKKKNRPSLTLGGSIIQRHGSFSENSSEIDSAVNSPDVPESMDASIDDVLPQPINPPPSSPLLSSLLSRSPGSSVLIGGSTPTTSPNKPGSSPLSASSQSPAVRNLIATALQGVEPLSQKDQLPRTPSCPGASTLSKLLELPPSVPVQPLPSINDLAETTQESAVKNGSKNGDSPETKPSVFREISCPPSSSIDSKIDTKDIKDIKGDIKIRQTEIKTDDSEQTIVKMIKEFQDGGVECKDAPDTSMLDSETKSFCKSSQGKFEEFDDCLKKKLKSEITTKNEVDSKPDVPEIDQKFSVKTLSEDEKIVTEEPPPTKKEEIQVEVVNEIGILEEHKPSKKRGRKKKHKDKKSSKNDKKSSGNEVNDSKNDKNLDKYNVPYPTYQPSKNSQNLSEILFDNLKESDRKKELLLREEAGFSSSTFKGFDGIARAKRSEALGFDDDESRASSDTRDELDEDDLPLSRTGKIKAATFSDMSGIESPVISESAPSSPASTHFGDDTEADKIQRLWKNSIKIVWNEIAAHKYASVFLKPIQEDKVQGYHSVVFRPMDLSKIKRNIDIGVIKNTAEFQRDLMLMFLNAKMYNTKDHNIYHMTTKMAQEAIETLEEFQSAQLLSRASDSPHKTFRRETRESASKKDDDQKRKRDVDDKTSKKRRNN